MRALRIAIVLALGALAGSCDDDDDATSPTDAGNKTFACCPLDPPSCHCPVSGTNKDGSCRKGPCDAVPIGWRTEIDERGCPYYVVGNTGSCLTPRPPPETGDHAVGTACTTNDDCGRSGVTWCSRMLEGTALGFCVREGCDPLLAACDSGRGICVQSADGSMCEPRCSFGADGAAPIGCAAGATCWFVSRDATSSEVKANGRCAVRCATDAECALGLVCERESGRCLSKPPTTTKSVGAACTSSSECFCMMRSAGGGFCTQLCHVGAEGACPSGTRCDPYLPIEFTTAPVGLGGICSKTCTTDADCTELNSTCVAAGGLSVKVCRPK